MNLWLLFFGMMAATYIPRALPSLLVGKIKFSPKFEKFLNLIPYTAMSALIFPGIFTTNPARLEIGIAGALAAILISWKKLPVMAAVLGAIFVDLIIYAAF